MKKFLRTLLAAVSMMMIISVCTFLQTPTPVNARAATAEYQEAKIVMSSDILTASDSVTFTHAYKYFTIEESWSVDDPYVAAATPSTLVEVSYSGNAYTAGVTFATISQYSIGHFATNGGVKVVKFTKTDGTPTMTAVVTRVIHASN